MPDVSKLSWMQDNAQDPPDVTLDVPDLEGDVEMPNEADMSWDEKCIVVRQGQLYIELQHRSPPMPDSILLSFCDWLDAQMPLVVQNFPYVRRSGAYVDLSENSIGPDGLDKLFRVLRDHRVPCVVMKAYRNVLDDSIVDTIVEYLYTQPESFPMHGIHCSHNSITDQGAFRLIQAAAKCGHYPRLTSRLPLWLRLECNHIANPQKVIADCNLSSFNVCLMGNGECSRPNCDHYSGVHVQLPYFFHQQAPGKMQQPVTLQPICKIVQPPRPLNQVKVQSFDEGSANELLSIYRSEEPISTGSGAAPDWQRKRDMSTIQAAMMVPAPKRQDFTPAPKKFMGSVMRPKAVGIRSGMSQSAMPNPMGYQDSAGGEADSGYISFSGADPQASPSPYLDSTPSGQETEPQTTSNGAFGDGDLAAGGPFGGKPSAQKEGGDVLNNFGGKDNAWKGGGKKGWKGGSGKGGKGGNKGGFKAFDNWDGGGCGASWSQDSFDGGWAGGKNFKGDKGKAGHGGGKGKGGKDGKDGKRGQYWVGPSLISKVKKDVQLSEADLQLGFMWQYLGDGIAPRVTRVDPNSKVAQVAQEGVSLLRMNGLDAAMLTEKQVTDLLKTRPMSLRFGDQ
jgi:hypothetical protein